MTLPEVAEAFQSLGYNVLLYDARTVGASGGQPRNLLDPLQMAEDLSGACIQASIDGIVHSSSHESEGRHLHICRRLGKR